MKILFFTNNHDAPSTLFNLAALKRLTEIDQNIIIDSGQSPSSEHDVILFMGYDHEIKRARQLAPSALVGVIDPRPGQASPESADFLITNGQEMSDWLVRYNLPMINYPIYPEVNLVKPKWKDGTGPVILGYHGNLIHLNNFRQRLATILPKLAKLHPLELHLVYNIKNKGKWDSGLLESSTIKIRHIQWEESVYEEHLANCDIGLCPAFIPVKRELFSRFRTVQKRYTSGENADDYIQRYKVTSNPGRALIFAQLGIPVIADAIPSITSLIEDGISGFTCISAEKWHYALRLLSTNPDLRFRMATKLQETFNNKYSRNYANSHFLGELKNLIIKKTKAF